MNKSREAKNLLELKFAHLAPEAWEELWRIGRTGWKNRGVPKEERESVQEHTKALREMLISMREELTEFSEKDIGDILDMLELHDYPESITGDEAIVTYDEVEKERLKAEKKKREIKAMGKICREMGETGEIAWEIWMRFEEKADPAAVFANELDKYQAIERAWEYELDGKTVSAMDFIKYADSDITHPVLRQRMEILSTKIASRNV